MTLIPYPPQRLDDLALRLLDLAATVRKMANSSRDNGISDFELHGQKIEEWLAKLEDWANQGDADLGAAIRRAQGARRAQAALAPSAPSRPGKRSATRKPKT